MVKQTILTFNLEGLDDLRKKVGDTYRARVGILGAKAARNGGPIDNVTLGIIQMFGSITKNIPPRDFLLMPIETHGKELVAKMRGKKIAAALAQGDIIRVFKLLGAAAEEFVQQAFETGGFGQWPPNKPSTIARKKSDRPLIATGQLRRAITSDVVKKSDIV